MRRDSVVRDTSYTLTQWRATYGPFSPRAHLADRNIAELYLRLDANFPAQIYLHFVRQGPRYAFDRRETGLCLGQWKWRARLSFATFRAELIARTQHLLDGGATYHDFAPAPGATTCP
ncbi:hypothetical protein [Dokdonella soli]|uniref:Uncharacterized protein n=1 Tax=Dokdonella soli TaxID=529810 RepID=A0ABP3U281_9GAMM